MTKLQDGKRNHEEESVAGKFSLRGQPHFIALQEGEGQNIPRGYRELVTWGVPWTGSYYRFHDHSFLSDPILEIDINCSAVNFGG